MLFSSIILVAVLLCCSAFFSGSETALFSLTRHQLLQCKQSSHRLRQITAELMDDPRRVLLTLLIGNTLVNIWIFAESYRMVENFHHDYPLGSALWGVGTIIAVVMAGEVLPKLLAASAAYSLAPWSAPILAVIQTLLTPVRWVLDSLLVVPITRLLEGQADQPTSELSVDELQELIDHSEKQGIIRPDETDMLQEVVALSSILVRSIMIPRVDMVAFDLSGNRDELLDLMRRNRLTKIPVYHKDVDHLLGFIHTRDLHVSPHRSLSELIRPARFVPEQATADNLLFHFRRTHTQSAIVVDEYGGVAGLITLEDVVEQIVGPIAEPGESTQLVEHPAPNVYLVSGRLDVRSWDQTLATAGFQFGVTTLGGLVTAQLGRLPREGDELTIGNIYMKVAKMRDRRVSQVLVQLWGRTGT